MINSSEMKIELDTYSYFIYININLLYNFDIKILIHIYKEIAYNNNIKRLFSDENFFILKMHSILIKYWI